MPEGAEEKPEFTRALARAKAQFESGRYELAAQSYREALLFEPENTLLWNNLGVCYLRLRDFAKAREPFERVLELDERYLNAKRNLAAVMLNTGDLRSALEMLLKALTQDPSDGRSWYNLACTHSLLGDAPKAIAALRRAVALAPKYRKRARRDEDFAHIRDDEGFKRVLSG